MSGGASRGGGIEFADTRTPGLILRVTPTASTFMLKTEHATVRLGEASRITVEQARDQATLARISLKRGRDPRRQVAAFEATLGDSGDQASAAEVAAAVDDTPAQTEADRRAHGPWLWRDLVAEFLEAKLPKLKPGYRAQYESYLRHTGFRSIQERLVADIRIADLERVRNAVVKSNTASAAHRVVQQGKEAMSWAWRYNAGISGLDVFEYEWWLRWSIEYSSGTREHVPTVDELARTCARRAAPFAWADGARDRDRDAGDAMADYPNGAADLPDLDPETRPPLPARRHAGVALCKLERGRDEGRQVGQPPPRLPLPPQALSVLKRLWAELDEPSPWACPSFSRRRSHPPVRGQQIAVAPGGTRPVRRPEARPGELASAARNRTVDAARCPRTLGSFLGDRRLGGAASAILSHKESKGEGEKERVAAVTRLHYDRGQRMALKAEGMELWTAAVLAAYERERAALALLPMPAPPPRTKRKPAAPRRKEAA